MRTALAATLMLLGMLQFGCKRDRTERVEQSYSTVTKPTYHPVPKLETPKPVVGTDAIPVEEEYEERAASTITEANLQAQLTELETELPF